MDLSLFPLEVLEVLAGFLSASDLSACSAVCYSWREAFDMDLFWRPFCEPRLAQYLRSERGLVKPRLDLTPCDALPSPCEWRLHQMRRAHLLRHWSKGRHRTHKLRFETAVVNCVVGADSRGRHWLAVNLGDRTEVWDVQTTPVFHAVFGNFTSAPSQLAIAGDKLVVVDFSYFVQTFHLRLPSLGFAPSSKFFYNDSESGSIDLSIAGEMDSIRASVRACFRKGHMVIFSEDFLIGYCSLVDSPTERFLHAWDMATETKVCEESMRDALGPKALPPAGAFVSADEGKLLCSLYLYDKCVSRLVIYDLKRRRFTGFGLTLSGKVDWCSISQGLVVTSHLLHQLHVYSVRSGALVNILDTNARSPFRPECGLQNLVLGAYVVQPGRECVRVVNVRCHWDSLMLYFCSVFQVVVIPPKLLAVSARPYAASSKVILEVWNIESKVRLFDCLVADSERPAFHSIQPLLTKMVIAVDDSVRVLSFW